MKNVIVTGANGFIGSSLIKKLVEKDIEVLAIDVSFANSRLPESKHIKTIETRIGTDLHEMIPLGKYDTFYHFAWRGVNGAEKADPLIQLQNVEMAMVCASAAKDVGCRKFLCAGTIAERATESLPRLNKTSGGIMYGVAKHCTHLMLEAYCKNIGLDFVWMQFSNIYGPNNKTGNLVSYTLGQLMENKEASFGPAMQPYDFVYVDDLLEAVFRLGEKVTNRNCYFIGSGKPKILRDYLFEIGEQTGKREFIKVGAREDDGIKYTMEMFDTLSLITDIGDYASNDFTEGIRKTIRNY